MDNEEITISSTSNKTADMTPIEILDETTRTQVRFELQQIDNEKDPEKKLSRLSPVPLIGQLTICALCQGLRAGEGKSECFPGLFCP